MAELTRDEHLAKCKAYALKMLDAGEPLDEVVTAMSSDVSKHPEMNKHPGIHIGIMFLMNGTFRGDPREVRKWIEGFR